MMFCIEIRYRKQGLGKYFYNYLEDIVRSRNYIFISLYVNITNTDAINFYFKNVFVVRDYIVNYYDYYPGSRDAYSLVKYL